MNSKQLQLKIETENYLKIVSELIGHDNFVCTVSIHNLPSEFFTENSREFKEFKEEKSQFKKWKHESIRLDDKKTLKDIDLYSQTSFINAIEEPVK
jgi:hypothetical protein